MWSLTYLEASTLTNFNFGFSTYKSDILIHLSQWQYWWWFWFSLFWSVYFYIIIRILNRRVSVFNPALNTSFRSHGKWGDFLVALIPLSWCGNILVNSNFILRMIEWQSESSLFTLRVQGKQWYWVYKFDGEAAQHIMSAPKNVGYNRWWVFTPTGSYCADSYFQGISLGSILEVKKVYEKDRLTQNVTASQKVINKNIYSTIKEKVSVSSLWRRKTRTFNHSEYQNYLKDFKDFKNLSKRIAADWKYVENSKVMSRKYRILRFYRVHFTKKMFRNILKRYINTAAYTKPIFGLYSKFYDYEGLDDWVVIRGNIWQRDLNRPINIIRGVLNVHNIEYLQHLKKKNISNDLSDITTNVEKLRQKSLSFKKISLYKILKTRIKTLSWRDLTRYKMIVESMTHELFIQKVREARYKVIYNTVGNMANELVELKAKLSDIIRIQKLQNARLTKPILFSLYAPTLGELIDKTDKSDSGWGFRQKRYKRFTDFVYTRRFEYDSSTYEIKKEVYMRPTVFNGILSTTFEGGDFKEVYDRGLFYSKSTKHNRHRSELVPVNLARRLLRTKRTLILPAHVNITVITNSLDVVHSWFIPGLGLKLDCVPGRSTHHMLYIDNIGFYYGQCAEICGRFHHHMPIRICALSFEHFLLWWHKRGLQRLNRLKRLKGDGVKPHVRESSRGTMLKNILPGGTPELDHLKYKYYGSGLSMPAVMKYREIPVEKSDYVWEKKDTQRPTLMV